jgi:hypothetical protein
MIKAIASLCNLNAFKTELMTALGAIIALLPLAIE